MDNMIKNNVAILLKEKNASPLALVSPGVSQGTAYGWANGTIDMRRDTTLEAVCVALTALLGRWIDVGDVLQRSPIPSVPDDTPPLVRFLSERSQ
jgi:hypothetical protein